MPTLTREQAVALRDKLQPKLAFIVGVRERMDRLGFPQSSALYQRVRAAENALHALYIEVHYLSCGSGVGKPADEV